MAETVGSADICVVCSNPKIHLGPLGEAGFKFLNGLVGLSLCGDELHEAGSLLVGRDEGSEGECNE